MSINNHPAAGKTITPRGTRSKSGKGRQALMVVLSLLAACLLLFGGGFLVGRSGLNAAKADLAKNKTESNRLLEQAKSENGMARSRLTAEAAKLQVADARTSFTKARYRSTGKISGPPRRT
jgi:hypothetical protein